MGNVKLTHEGRYVLLDRLLQSQTLQKWQTILDQARPAKGYRILVVSIEKLTLFKPQLESFKKGEIVLVENILNYEAKIITTLTFNNGK